MNGSKRARGGSFANILGGCLLAAAACAPAQAQRPVVTTIGCPIFHCTPEATGVIYQPLVQNPTRVLANSALGTLSRQGCSGDGARLACLYTVDNVTAGVAKGTLKVLDAATLQPIWGSAGAADSYDILPTSNPAGFSSGQVPVLFADGRLAAGDSLKYVLYDKNGKALKSIALNGTGKNMGMTPISAKYGVIAQAGALPTTPAVLTLVDLASWTKVSTLLLRVDGAAVVLVSPPSAHAGVLYAAVGRPPINNPRGYLFAVALGSDARTRVKLVLRSTFPFLGVTGASPVIVPPAVTGLAGNLVLLHTPGLVGGAVGNHQLMGLLDSGGSTMTDAWPPIALSTLVEFAPTVDEVSKSLFFQVEHGKSVYRHSVVTGQFLDQYDLHSIGGFGPNFELNGHLLANQSQGVFTLLLSGSSAGGTTQTDGQYAMGFRPLVEPGGLLWSMKIGAAPDDLTEAWAIGPSARPGLWCPIVVGSTSGISKICD